MKLISFLIVCGLTSVLLLSCSDDDKKEATVVFTSQEQADSAFWPAYNYCFYSSLVPVGDIPDLLGYFSDSDVLLKALITDKHEKLRKPTAFQYNSGNGWWTDDRLYDYGDDSAHIINKVRFTSRDAQGYPTHATSKMEWKETNVYHYEDDEEDEDEWGNKNTDVTITRIGSYLFNENDSLIINGTVESNESGRYERNSIDIYYNLLYDADYKNVIVSNIKQVPNSGEIRYTIRFRMNPADPNYIDYYTSATLRFNGTTAAVIQFGGWEYPLNIDDLKKK